jgi:hypothetical protein
MRSNCFNLLHLAGYPRRLRLRPAGWMWACLLVIALGASGIYASNPGGAVANPAGPASAWVDAAVRNEVTILQQQGTFSVQYTERKIDTKGDVTRLIIESREGGVARLIERNGEPITAAEDAAERTRLGETANHRDEFLRHHRHDASTRNDAVALMKLMPTAMIYTYAAGQPQLPNVKSPQTVLDFTPNPKFHAPTMLSEALTGFAGRVWIDEANKHVTRIEGKVLHPVNFGFGILARLYPGGTVALEQVDAGDGHWVYSHIEDHLVVRAMMVKTVNQSVEMRSSHIEPLPALLGFQDAIKKLLATQIPLH